jgi:hypothetical protein
VKVKQKEKETKSKMSIFASQPLSTYIPPSLYIASRNQAKTPSYKSNPDSAISLPTSTRSDSTTSELLPQPQPVHSVRTSRSSSVSSASSAETTNSKHLEAPSYAPIKTPSPLALNPTNPRPGTGISSSQPKKNPLPSYTATISSSSSSAPSTPAKKATWKSLWLVSENSYDEEYEMRMRAEREDSERGQEKLPGEWCWGCLWVGPYEQPWVAHYIF